MLIASQLTSCLLCDSYGLFLLLSSADYDTRDTGMNCNCARDTRVLVGCVSRL